MQHHTVRKTLQRRHFVVHNVGNIPHKSPLGNGYGDIPVLKDDVFQVLIRFKIYMNDNRHMREMIPRKM